MQDAVRCREAGVPEGIGYATKGELARAMLDRALEAGVPAAWVTGVEPYGKDEGLRRRLRGQRKPYVLAMERSKGMRMVVDGLPTEMWTEPSAPNAFVWQQMMVGIGNEGPLEWARGRLPRRAAVGWVQWLLVRRWGIPPKKKHVYYRAYSPEKTSLAELARAAGTSLVVQEGLERAKGQVGLDQYEVRRWEAWHRHVTLSLLAHAALEVTRARERVLGKRRDM